MVRFERVRGSWYTGDGVLDRNGEPLEVEIRGDQLYDPELRSLGEDARIELNGHELRCWADAYFVLDGGELERLALTANSAVPVAG